MVYPKEATKIRWGNLEEEDEHLDFVLSTHQVIRPDESGIIGTMEYKFDNDGNMVKITTITYQRTRAIERPNLPKFGDSVHEDIDSHLTMVYAKEIVLGCPKPIGYSLTRDASGSTNDAYVPRCMRGGATAYRFAESSMRRRIV
ncbi:uncharacterized protein LOC131597656 [Vicia villosa]|uniref:uncharacterized protein LOC131597656 n=1 Tax=Vicia villosa TaxID=3911 RepID=UPI00273B4392|nr:uncharacterized protein LOC131597656 [Vicia villosa]